MMIDLQEVQCWVDGSCWPNPGPGGWGAILRYHFHEKEMWGGDEHATNNKMELTAAIRALSALKRPCVVHLWTDSKYVKNGYSWCPLWRRNHWITSAGTPVKNRELWEELEQAASAHAVIFRWIRGHAGTMMNERADRLARRGRDELRPFGT